MATLEGIGTALTAKEMEAKKIQTIENWVQKIDRKVTTAREKLKSIVLDRIFGEGQKEKEQNEGKPVSRNKLDRIINDLEDISKSLDMLIDKELSELDKELSKL